MDKIIKRGLRQLKTGFNTLENYRKRNLIKIDKNEIRKKVQSLHEVDEFEFEEWGVGSKFRMEAFEIDQDNQIQGVKEKDSFKALKVTDLKTESIVKFVCEAADSSGGGCGDLKIYESKSRSGPGSIDDEMDKSIHVLFSSPSTPSRRAILQTILTEFKPLFKDRRIAVDGAKDKKADWIVIDLKGVVVHIFDADTRASVDLDGKLEKEMNEVNEDADEGKIISYLMDSIKNSLPRAIASRPNFIEKYLKSRRSGEIPVK